MRGNSHLSKVQLSRQRQTLSGAEYLTSFLFQNDKSATGRTQNAEFVVLAISDWVRSRVSREQLYERHDFVDAKRRALHSVADEINARLTVAGAKSLVEHVAEDSEFDQLWIYAAQRSARLEPGLDGTVDVALLLKRTQIALGEGLELEAAARASLLWADRTASLSELTQSIPNLTLSPLAAEFERGDYSAWHWGNLLLQAEHDDVLGYFRPLIERIAQHKVLSRFFSFTSLNRLCFSYCSLYPFDTEGLPMVVPMPRTGIDHAFAVMIGSDTKPAMAGTAAEVFSFLENILTKNSRPTWFGNVDEDLAARLNCELEARGSPLRATSRQSEQWLRVEVVAGNLCCAASFDGRNVMLQLSRPWQARREPIAEFVGRIDKGAEQIIAWLSQND